MRDSWIVVEAEAVNREMLLALFRNEIAAIRVPAFVAADQCALIAAAIKRWGFDYYRDVDPPIGRIGITQYEHGSELSAYLQRSADAASERQELFGSVLDPLDGVVAHMVRAGFPNSRIAQEVGRGDYFAGLVRLLGAGALIHCDWAPRDAPGWAISEVEGQIAWNVYVASGEGGETVVYDQPWRPALEGMSDKSSYGYLPKAVEGIARVEVSPEVGQLLLFNSRNLHSVNPTADRGERITVTSFIGLLRDESLVFWS